MNPVVNSSENMILVVGATGGVGQLVVGKLLAKNLPVRIFTRNRDKVNQMFNHENHQVDIAIGDIRESDTITSAMVNVTSIICCTGTSAFPSDKWQFTTSPNFIDVALSIFNRDILEGKAKNSPMKVDSEGVKRLVSLAPKNLHRFVLVSSCGILRKNEFPFKILNLFGVLDAKKQGEDFLINSGIPYTIIRPARLIDGPYTSSDLNTLLQATTNGKLNVVLGTGDQISGESSRIDVAAACVESLFYETTVNKVFEIVNQGERTNTIDWERLFSQL
ncbi:SDR family oxidoreductase [Anabaena sp. FACHB-1237]|uniref:SDR family oxidoreductase n=1 Tax=Anabaena sp. FACHB-1237 TaxID=2692769 RepID=UPI00168149A7|nr:SDR family oxidoreductase [Anabaena sp. FACHB-1237]MBD2138366.1 SDR family oxidoreductase [Anabaena sp. FACHB-1237]